MRAGEVTRRSGTARIQPTSSDLMSSDHKPSVLGRAILGRWKIEVRGLWHGLYRLDHEQGSTLSLRFAANFRALCNNLSFSIVESSCYIVCQMRILFAV